MAISTEYMEVLNKDPGPVIDEKFQIFVADISHNATSMMITVYVGDNVEIQQLVTD